MFSLAVLFFCQSLMQFLKDAISFSTGNMHYTVGIEQPTVQWLLQCLQEEVMHLLTGAFWGYLASGPGSAGLHWLGLLSATTAGIYAPGRGGMNYPDLQEMLFRSKLSEKQG